MNEALLKNLRFLPTLFLIPFAYLAAWLLPWREGEDDQESYREASTKDEPVSQPVPQELVTQA